MGYTKFCYDVTKWLNENRLPWRGTSLDTPEDTQDRLSAWDYGTEQVFRQWLSDQRYKELIACAHWGWYSDEKILEPLAEYFVECKMIDHLKFLCERGVRYVIEDMFGCMKRAKREGYTVTAAEVNTIHTWQDKSTREYRALEEIQIWRGKAMDCIDRYLGYLERTSADSDYMEVVKEIRGKVEGLNIKLKDLQAIKCKL